MDPTKEYNFKTKMTSVVRKPFPYVPSVKEIAYQNFISKITDPVTNTFYPPRTEDGSPIIQTHGPNARYVVINN